MSRKRSWLLPSLAIGLLALASSSSVRAGELQGQEAQDLGIHVERVCSDLGKYSIECKKAGLAYLKAHPVPCERGADKIYHLKLVQEICTVPPPNGGDASDEARNHCYGLTVQGGRSAGFSIAPIEWTYDCYEKRIPNSVELQLLTPRESRDCYERKIADEIKDTEAAIATARASQSVDQELQGHPSDLIENGCKPATQARTDSKRKPPQDHPASSTVPAGGAPSSGGGGLPLTPHFP